MATPHSAMAFAHHCVQNGDFRRAEAAFLDMTQRWPDWVMGYDGLGQLYLQAKRYQSAIGYLRQAIQRDPNTASRYNNLSLACCSQRDFAAAERAGRAALRLDPGYVEAWNNLGNALLNRQEWALARAAYREALRHRPNYVKAWLNLARVELLLNNGAAARRAVRRAHRFTSPTATSWRLLAQAEQSLRNYPAALDAAEQALSRSPADLELLILKGGLLRDTFKPEAAIKLLQKLTRQVPGNTAAWNDLGLTFDCVNRLSEGLAAYDQAIAAIAAEGRRLQGERRIELTPESMANLHRLRYNRTMNYLKQGDFDRGWAEYFHRWNGRDRDFDQEFGIPRWQGEALSGQHLIIATEQGLGDTLQFIRYLDLLLERNRPARITLATMPALAELLADYPGIDEMILPEQNLPSAHCYALLMDLPYWLQTRLDSIPARVPYLPIAPQRLDDWRQRLAALAPGRRIGIAWQGNPAYAQDHYRSLALDSLLPLFELPDIQWVQLQRNAGTEQIAERNLPLQDLDDKTLTETAALVAQLDLVITSDSMLAHLAGALGRPVWLLLSTKGEWRWLTEREDSPWYPSMRLFRQSRPGDWPELVGRVCAALAEGATA
jgi:tetratricopeptide (TPR) repeat protein/predicted nuclease of predicted toxin-antitoxin system